jgi:hypothetical protein
MANLVLCYGPLQQIWLCAMGHCGELGNALWATAADLLYKRYGATVRNEAVQYKSVTIPVLWAIAQDLVVPYGP